MNAREALLFARDKGYSITPDGRELVTQRRRGGYGWFRPCRGASVAVHRLQAHQKYGDAMFAHGIECRHLDGNPWNNKASNIAIGTKSENSMDKVPEVRMAAALKATAGCTKHDHVEIVAFLSGGNSYRAAMTRFGIRSKGTISFIARKSRSAQTSRREEITTVSQIRSEAV